MFSLLSLTFYTFITLRRWWLDYCLRLLYYATRRLILEYFLQVKLSGRETALIRALRFYFYTIARLLTVADVTGLSAKNTLLARRVLNASTVRVMNAEFVFSTIVLQSFRSTVQCFIAALFMTLSQRKRLIVLWKSESAFQLRCDDFVCFLNWKSVFQNSDIVCSYSYDDQFSNSSKRNSRQEMHLTFASSHSSSCAFVALLHIGSSLNETEESRRSKLMCPSDLQRLNGRRLPSSTCMSDDTS